MDLEQQVRRLRNWVRLMGVILVANCGNWLLDFLHDQTNVDIAPWVRWPTYVLYAAATGVALTWLMPGHHQHTHSGGNDEKDS